MPFHTMPPWHTMKYHDNNITIHDHDPCECLLPHMFSGRSGRLFWPWRRYSSPQHWRGAQHRLPSAAVGGRWSWSCCAAPRPAYHQGAARVGRLWGCWAYYLGMARAGKGDGGGEFHDLIIPWMFVDFVPWASWNFETVTSGTKGKETPGQ
jgi:hypothetical protein